MIKLELDVAELDFVVVRLVAGKMDYNTAMRANFILNKIQAQANDKGIQNAKPDNAGQADRKGNGDTGSVAPSAAPKG